ncbi:hypothetical protein CPB83DRAFT_831736 [Crepidotus variabilis]|uniref:Uncharacterized protein n=1 Tax=Crepidotus variabilis TaxID=179855 RepID=A0A9P6JVH8_9AGAR|nr:hypothetical protein CPB83DRAFT_831736 [Crepidotus variabilis]
MAQMSCLVVRWINPQEPPKSTTANHLQKLTLRGNVQPTIFAWLFAPLLESLVLEFVGLSTFFSQSPSVNLPDFLNRTANPLKELHLKNADFELHDCLNAATSLEILVVENTEIKNSNYGGLEALLSKDQPGYSTRPFAVPPRMACTRLRNMHLTGIFMSQAVVLGPLVSSRLGDQASKNGVVELENVYARLLRGHHTADIEVLEKMVEGIVTKLSNSFSGESINSSNSTQCLSSEFREIHE